MRSTALPRFSLVLGLLLVASLAAGCAASTGGQKVVGKTDDPYFEREIRIEKIPAQRVLYQTIVGPYDKHPEVFAAMKGAITQAMREQGLTAAVAEEPTSCQGIYPFDPDAVQRLEWAATITVPRELKAPAAQKLSVEASRYEVKTMPAVTAAVMFTTVDRMPTDGLKFFAWMAENGYVQVAPTRTIYLTQGGDVDVLKMSVQQLMSGKVKIIVPIEKRKRDISLKKAKASPTN